MPVFSPSAGARLNRLDTLSDRLRIAVPLAEGWGDAIYDHASGLVLTYSGTPTWVMSGLGWTLDFGPSSDYAVGVHTLTEAELDGPLTFFSVTEFGGASFSGHITVRVGSSDYLVWDPSRNGGSFSLKNNTTFNGLKFGAAYGIHSCALVTSGGNISSNGVLYLDGSVHTPSGTGATDVASGTNHRFCLGDWAGESVFQQGVCYLWTRQLAAAEIARLHADPYAMFRRPSPIFLFGGGGAPIPTENTTLITASSALLTRQEENVTASVTLATQNISAATSSVTLLTQQANNITASATLLTQAVTYVTAAATLATLNSVSITSSSVLLARQSESITASAFLLGEKSAHVTASATLVANVSESVTASAALAIQPDSAITASSTLASQATAALTATATLLARQPESVTASAFLLGPKALRITSTAALLARQESSATAASVLAIRGSASSIASSVLVSRWTAAISASAYLSGAVWSQVTVSSTLLSRQVAAATASSSLASRLSTGVTSDATLAYRVLESVTATSSLLAQQSSVATASVYLFDARLKRTKIYVTEKFDDVRVASRCGDIRVKETI